ncbi:uncharacterized protein LOC110860388 [Folsomia candida]|uniref:uncharacterized protein LOC110860388 n=1 Tax=Folsomia candida TaxID=158441 RepID=UPI000B8F855C|nr:uncharacterized protein LOC110860388 [Folsomia candida]
MWTDSTLVLRWIASFPGRWKTFVANRASSFSHLVRVSAYVRRFIANTRYPSKKFTGPISPSKLKNSLTQLIRTVQGDSFAAEINDSQNSKSVCKTRNIHQLNPFLDGEGTLRVGGRLSRSPIHEEAKHQAIRPHDHHLTTLIVRDCHLKNLHSGFQATWSTLLQQVWILRGRNTIRQIIRKCVICRRHRAQLSQQLMGNLPVARVTPNPPFLHVGVDYAGPSSILKAKGRGQRSMKSYFAIFICFSTKAVHQEAVTNPSTEAFFACLRRFSARRGVPGHIYSDCGTNFQGADKELEGFYLTEFNENVAEGAAAQGISWHMNAPSSPHHGGLWESGVKAVKYHTRRVMGNAHLTLEEFATLLCQVESILNSRPLCAMSPDPGDLQALTPGHFLIGRPLNSIADPDVTHINTNKLSRW